MKNLIILLVVGSAFNFSSGLGLGKKDCCLKELNRSLPVTFTRVVKGLRERRKISAYDKDALLRFLSITGWLLHAEI